MQSNGGLTDAAAFRGKDAILSGPAGGIVGMVRTAAEAGFDRVIGFDMGGTSTDVSHFAGSYERTSERAVAGVRVRAPMLEIHTVAAGGGSVCCYDGRRFRVGPDSAGAVPGPACYRRGGPLTVTDCNVVLGKIRAEHFPRVFGPNGDEPIDAGASLALCGEIAARAGMTAKEAAEGFVRIAVDNMANAIKQISIARGHDVTRYTLQCFGGAGGQHACLVADALGIECVMIHPLAGVLSAYGMGLADMVELRQRTFGRPLAAEAMADFHALQKDLAGEAEAALHAQGVPAPAVVVRLRAALRYEGSDSTLEVPVWHHKTMRKDFDQLHYARFGFDAPETEVVVETAIVEAVGKSDCVPAKAGIQAGPGPGPRPSPGNFFDRGDLRPGDILTGPDPHHRPLRHHGRRTRLARRGGYPRQPHPHPFPAPRRRHGGGRGRSGDAGGHGQFVHGDRRGDGGGAPEHRLLGQHQGTARFLLRIVRPRGQPDRQRTAHSGPSRLDGGFSIRTLIEARGDIRDGRGMIEGDVYVLNAPYRGGTHLPDITVVMPVFVEGDKAPAWYVAARGHHADIGGIAPGSMPPDSKTVHEEGVLIDNVLLVDGGRFREAEMRALLASGEWPARNPDRNVADLKAQVAACARGATELRRVAGEYGREAIDAYMSHVMAYAEEAVRRLIGRLSDGEFTYEMDNGARVSVAIRVDRAARSAEVDFSGTSAQQSNNFNAPYSICRAATLYVFRTLVDDAIPLNDGCMRPLTLRVPEGSMLNPRYPAAVVAGNVETSQVITDCLFAAAGALAPSQGTMNNFTFGNAAHQYYETIAGGAGAGPGFEGASAVQTHMTNSRLTDPEILETRYPVILERFAIRCGSGGEGAQRGGDGVVRQIRFREPMKAGILSNRRRVAPRGIMGGGDAKAGVNKVLRADGTEEVLSATASADMAVGDAFVIETPGGGGYGQP